MNGENGEDPSAATASLSSSRAYRAALRVQGGSPGGAGSLCLLAGSTVLTTVLRRDPAANTRLLRRSAVYRGGGGPAHSAFYPPSPAMVPVHQGGDARGGQLAQHRWDGLPRPGYDRRDLPDHRCLVRRRGGGGCHHRPRRGVRLVLVRGALASLARVASEWRYFWAPSILPNILTQIVRDPEGSRPGFSTSVYAPPRERHLPVSP